jgi:hypothetical protein
VLRSPHSDMGKKQTPVQVGQHWLPPATVTPIRVLAVVEGYAMVRHLREPYTLKVEHIQRYYQLLQPSAV